MFDPRLVRRCVELFEKKFVVEAWRFIGNRWVGNSGTGSTLRGVFAYSQHVRHAILNPARP